jgi:hypothetical protein
MADRMDDRDPLQRFLDWLWFRVGGAFGRWVMHLAPLPRYVVAVFTCLVIAASGLLIAVLLMLARLQGVPR